MSDTMSTNSDWEYLQRDDCIYPWCKKITDGIKNEVNEVITSKMWPFSTYGPFDLKPSLPNYIEDLSFEELRLKYYQAKKENTLDIYEQEISQLMKKKNHKSTELIAFTKDFVDKLYEIHQTPIYTTCCGLKYIIKPFGRRIEKSDDSQDGSKDIEKFIMNLMLVDMLPYSLVEGIVFQRIQFAGNKSYQLRNKDFFRSSQMPDTLMKLKAKVMAKLDAAKWISITIHIWQSPDNSCMLLVFVANFIVGNLRKFVILKTSILEEHFKDVNIANKLQETIAYYNLENKMHLCIYKGKNPQMEEALKCESLECIGYTLELIIDEVVLKKQYIQEIITKCQLIKTQLNDNNSKPSQDQKNIKAEWIDLYLMIKALIKAHKEGNLYTNEQNNIITLTPVEWLILNDIVNILELFYEIVMDLTAITASTSLIIPLINTLKTKLNELDTKEDLKNNLILKLNAGFKFIENSKILITATLLDPRFKNKYLNETQMHIAEHEIKQFLTENDNETDNIPNKEITEGFQMLGIKSHDLDDNAIQKELSLYMLETLEHRKFNIYEYWLKSTYKNLREYSLKYLTAPPTIIAKEEFINAGGKLYNERSAVLKEFKTDELLFCHYNIQMFNFDY